jgi:hypothetical protein
MEAGRQGWLGDVERLRGSAQVALAGRFDERLQLTQQHGVPLRVRLGINITDEIYHDIRLD